MSKQGSTTKKDTVLAQFRQRVIDVIKPEDDHEEYLMKWLRARRFDVAKAEAMLRKSMEWRKKWEVDTILTDWKCPEVLEKYDIGGISGFDKEGCPIWIYKAANLDMKGLSLSVRRVDVLRKYIWKMEYNKKIMREQSEKLGKRIDKVVMIEDMEGYTMKQLLQPGMDVILKVLGIIEANYPETLKKCYVIHASSMFPLIFKICKPFMSHDTRSKVAIVGSNWKEQLLSVIDADQLPKHWGGTRLDPISKDEFCSSLVRMGGPVPSSYNLKADDLVDPSKIKKVVVTHGHFIRVEAKTLKQNLMIRYTFWTEYRDIKFGVYYKPTEESAEEQVVESLRRVDSHMIPEDGTVKCAQPGIYLFQFDNKDSWFHNKHLSYVVEILDPEVMSKDPEHTCDQSSGSSFIIPQQLADSTEELQGSCLSAATSGISTVINSEPKSVINETDTPANTPKAANTINFADTINVANTINAANTLNAANTTNAANTINAANTTKIANAVSAANTTNIANAISASNKLNAADTLNVANKFHDAATVDIVSHVKVEDVSNGEIITIENFSLKSQEETKSVLSSDGSVKDTVMKEETTTVPSNLDSVNETVIASNQAVICANEASKVQGHSTSSVQSETSDSNQNVVTKQDAVGLDG